MEPNYTENNFGDESTTSSKIKDTILELIEFVAIIAAILIVIRFFIAEPHKVSGSSMVPNFEDGDYIITNKLAAKIGTIARGEVIILQNPRNSSQVFIKRIIGLPGEKIIVHDGMVFIDGKKLNESYLPASLLTPSGVFLQENEEVTIPADQYVVLGDNRSASSDSREWGPIKESLVIGQAFLRYWPPQKLTLIKINNKSL